MIEKDFRALLPGWLACAAGMVLAASWTDLVVELGIPIYFFGAATLGSVVVGHEYTHRTLATLLSLPISRARVWLSKLAVLAVMLVALAALAAFTLPTGRNDHWLGAGSYVMPLVAALFIAPWVTLLTRSSLAGTVFTFVPPGLLLVAGDWIGLRRFGPSPAADVFRTSFMWWGMLALCATGAMFGWRRFAQLEVPDGRAAAVDLLLAPGGQPGVATRARRSALRQLINKELRLQQVSYVIAAIYVAAYVSSVISKRGQPVAEDLATMVTVLYALLVSPVIGAMACAEERGLGTHDAQLLLPVSSARLWVVKAGTALTLTTVLTALLPLALAWLLPPDARAGHSFTLTRFAHDTPVWLPLVFATLALFVSSLAESGMRAVLLSIPALFGLITFMLRVALPLSYDTLTRVYHPGRGMRWPAPLVNKDLAAIVFLTSVVLLVLRLALSNYRTADRSRVRVGLQVLWTAAAIVACAVLAGALAVI